MRRAVWIILILFCVLGSATAAERVVLVSIDGLRADVVSEENTPVLWSLIRRGTYCPRARTVRPSLTVPAHASMITGLLPAKHGSGDHDYRPGYLEVPTLFTFAKKAGLGNAVLIAKPKMRILANPRDVEFIYAPPVPQDWDSPNDALLKRGVARSYAGPPDTTADGIADTFAKEWPSGRFETTLVHFRDADAAGHAHDWMSDEYLEAVKKCDRALGKVLDAIGRLKDAGETVVIVTSDHGGRGGHHGKDLPENNLIPWVCAGPGIPKGRVVEREIRIEDTAPTALKLLNLPVPEKLDGKPVSELFQ